VHNSLRHLYGAVDPRRSHYHCDQIFRRVPTDSYIFVCITGEIMTPKPPAEKVRANLLAAIEKYPDLTALVATCRLKLAELASDPAEKKVWLRQVIEAKGEGIERHQKLARDRLGAIK
jgi:hypothetical protein